MGFCMCMHHENHIIQVIYCYQSNCLTLLSLLAGPTHLCIVEEGLVKQLLYKAVIHHDYVHTSTCNLEIQSTNST